MSWEYLEFRINNFRKIREERKIPVTAFLRNTVFNSGKLLFTNFVQLLKLNSFKVTKEQGNGIWYPQREYILSGYPSSKRVLKIPCAPKNLPFFEQARTDFITLTWAKFSYLALFNFITISNTADRYFIVFIPQLYIILYTDLCIVNHAISLLCLLFRLYHCMCCRYYRHWPQYTGVNTTVCPGSSDPT